MVKRHSVANTWMILFLICALAACTGGSGSSGFDSLENAAISDALQEQRCVEVEGIIICPSDSTQTPLPLGPSPTPSPTTVPVLTPTPTSSALDNFSPTPTSSPAEMMQPTGTVAPVFASPTGSPRSTASASPTPTPTATASHTPTPTPPAGVQVDTNVAGLDVIDCQPATGGRCTFVFSFAPTGLPESAIFAVAVRIGNAPWTIVAPIATGSAMAPSFEAEVDLEPGSSADTQFAVLAFLQGSESIPRQVAALGDSGADLAFVTPRLLVREQ